MKDSTRDQVNAGPFTIGAPLVCAILQVLTPLLPGLGVGQPIGEQSDSVKTLITPAGWAFSIWGALYAGAFAYAIFQALPSQRSNPVHGPLRLAAAGAFLGNAIWALSTQISGFTGLSAIIIFATLACLLRAFHALAAWSQGFTALERWCVILPLSALTSWLTAASIVNVAASLQYYGVDGGETAPLISASVLILGGVIASVALVRSKGNPPYALVFLWALAAIFAAGGQQTDWVAISAVIAGVLVLGAALYGLVVGGSDHWFGTRDSRSL